MAPMDKNENIKVDTPTSETSAETEEILLPKEPATPEELIEQLKEQLESKTAEAGENWNRFLREKADLENFRKRTSREKEELLNYGVKSLIEEILPVVDNMERALAHSCEEESSAVVEGVKMTHSMLMSSLRKFGVTPVEASPGTLFDPAFHQAMNKVETGDFPPNSVVEEFQKGYMLRERLLRPAMVSVATALPE
jgi:molecular chaperone GrpE